MLAYKKYSLIIQISFLFLFLNTKCYLNNSITGGFSQFELPSKESRIFLQEGLKSIYISTFKNYYNDLSLYTPLLSRKQVVSGFHYEFLVKGKLNLYLITLFIDNLYMKITLKNITPVKIKLIEIKNK